MMIVASSEGQFKMNCVDIIKVTAGVDMDGPDCQYRFVKNDL
jgi:hypothetical protein